MAFLFASHGAKKLVCADLTPSPSPGIDGEVGRTDEEVCERYGQGKAVFMKCDVGDSGDVKAVVERAVAEGNGRLDL